MPCYIEKPPRCKSRDSVPARPVRPPIGNSPLLIRSRVLAGAGGGGKSSGGGGGGGKSSGDGGGFHLDMGLPLTARRQRRAAHHDSGGIFANQTRCKRGK